MPGSGQPVCRGAGHLEQITGRYSRTMAEAPRERPPAHTVLLRNAGHIRARPKPVFDAIDRRMRPPEGSGVRYFADPTAFLVIVQGGWWYREEFRVVPDENGSHVEHYILNVAQTAHWMGPVAGRRVLREAPGVFQRLVRQLRLDLE
jgi:hypothetical protein